MDAKLIHIAAILSIGLLPSMAFARSSVSGGKLVYASDIVICKQVRNALQSEKNLHVIDIRVTTLNGFVQLTGYVRFSDDLVRAEQVAQSVRGVVQVKNDLLLKGEIRA